MTYQLEISAFARDDLDEAYNWYDRKRPGLGDEFLECVEEAYETIRRSPTSTAVLFEGLRRVAVRRFPYGIYYRVAEQRIEVLAVCHARRDLTALRLRSRG